MRAARPYQNELGIGWGFRRGGKKRIGFCDSTWSKYNCGSPESPIYGEGQAVSGRETDSAGPLVEPLTRRERQVLALLAEGYSGPEIAEKLTLALSSV